MLELLDFNENPNLGVFCRCNDDIVFIRPGLPKKTLNKVKNVLEAELVEFSVSDANIVGSLMALNSKGAVLTDFADKKCVKVIRDLGLNVCVIGDIYNAAGNDILVNDSGCMVHPDISDESIRLISKTFDVPVHRGKIGGLKNVGMAAVVTNKGSLCHPKVTDEEKNDIKKIFDVDVMIGTVNHGSPVIGSGLVSNSKGCIIGDLTTGIEMGRIEEALGFLD